MHLKAITAYALTNTTAEIDSLIAAGKEGLAALSFVPCGPTLPMSAGFAPPRGVAHGELVERVGHHCIFLIRTEQRLLPASVVRDRVEEMAEAIEKESGRKPGSKRRRELKDEAMLDLLPQAFTRESALSVWVDPIERLLVVGSTSASKTDLALSLLTKALPGLAPAPLQTAESPAACMRAWLTDGVAPEGFGIGRDATLKAQDASGASVRYAKHGLDGQHLQIHLNEGKQVRQMALNWKDRVDFTLQETLQLRKVSLEVAQELSTPGANDDPFDADAALTTGELSLMIPQLLVGLGGRIEGLGGSSATGVQA